MIGKQPYTPPHRRGERKWIANAYLTVDERTVPPGESQRRAGLHTESPGATIRMGERDKIRGPSAAILPWGSGEFSLTRSCIQDSASDRTTCIVLITLSCARKLAPSDCGDRC